MREKLNTIREHFNNMFSEPPIREFLELLLANRGVAHLHTGEIAGEGGISFYATETTLNAVFDGVEGDSEELWEVSVPLTSDPIRDFAGLLREVERYADKGGNDELI